MKTVFTMKSTKLIQLLGSLTKEEFNQFSQYTSKLYSDHTTPLKIFRHIANYYPDFESPEMDKQFILTEILQLENSPQKRVSNEFHKLFEWLHDFLILEHTKKDTISREKLVLEIYRNRKLDNLFYKKANAILKKINQTKLSVWNYLYLMQINYLLYYYPATKKSKNISRLFDQIGKLP